MLIKTPKFWMRRNYISYSLLPLSLIYKAAKRVIDLTQQTTKVSKPIICVGNLTVGGSGKTPVALALGKILQEMSVEFAYLSRGYLGKKNQFGYVDKVKSMSCDVGDEPLILAEVAPTFVAKDRLQGARQIIKNRKIQAIILDDGMQNNLLQKDLTILVIDSKIQFGNEFIFPAGPLRESVGEGLAKADFVVVIGEVDEKLQQILANKKIISAKIKAKNLANFSGQKLMAFCGLAHPKKFFSFLENQGLNVVNTQSFADHHSYKISELERLVAKAKKLDAKLIATKKDWVKFPSNFKRKIEYLDIDLEFVDKEFIKDQLKKLLIK